MRLGKGATVDTVPWLFISRHSCVILMSLVALGSSVGMGINTSGIDLCGHQCTTFEITLPPVRGCEGESVCSRGCEGESVCLRLYVWLRQL